MEYPMQNNKDEHVLAESPVYKRLKAKLQQRNEKEETKQITSQATLSGSSPFYAKYTGYPTLIALKDPLNPSRGQIIIGNSTKTEEQCYNWTTLDKGLYDAMESFKQGACNLTAFDTNQTRDGYDAFTGYIPLISNYDGSVTIKVAGTGTHSGYQVVGATSAGATFTAAQLGCVDSVLRDGVVPFIDSTNGYAGCPAPASKIDAATAGAVFGTIGGLAGCIGIGWGARNAYKLYKHERESRQPLISASSSASSATATAAPATTATAQPRKSWCPSFSFRSAQQAPTPTPAAASSYDALADAPEPSNGRVLPLEVESGSKFSIQ